MLTVCTVVIVATLAPTQDTDNNVPKEIRQEMEYLDGRWTGTKTVDGEQEKVGYSARWTSGRDSLLLSFSSKTLNATGVNGWDPTTAEMVEVWHSPTHGRLTLRYKPVSDTTWVGTSRLQNPDGEVIEGTIRLEKKGKDAFNYVNKTGNTTEEIAYSRIVVSQPPTNADRIKPMAYFIGNWVGETLDGGKVTWEFEWGVGKNFIENEIISTARDASLRFSNTGMIGWDNNYRQIVNWCLTNTGGRRSFGWEKRDDTHWNTWIIGSSSTWTATIVDDDTFILNANGDVVTYRRQADERDDD